MNYRFAGNSDVHCLAVMNHSLIRDEGHRNQMTIDQLASRMVEFFLDGYRAVIFECDGALIGYALYRFEPEWVYLRHFYVSPSFRRQGIGTAALNWLSANAWSDVQKVRIEVLIGNSSGIGFWRSVGFLDYCLTMER